MLSQAFKELFADSAAVAKGHVVLPKSVTPSRIEQNLQTVKLDPSDVEALDSIHKKKGLTRFVYPAFGVSVPFPSSRMWWS